MVDIQKPLGNGYPMEEAAVIAGREFGNSGVRSGALTKKKKSSSQSRRT